MLPYIADSHEYPSSWPDDVGKKWLEVQKVYQQNLLELTATSARITLQLALRHMLAKGKTFYEEIAYLAKSGMLLILLRDWAHEVRILGNDYAHPTPDAPPVLKEDVQDIVNFISLLCDYLFTLPERIT